MCGVPLNASMLTSGVQYMIGFIPQYEYTQWFLILRNSFWVLHVYLCAHSVGWLVITYIFMYHYYKIMSPKDNIAVLFSILFNKLWNIKIIILTGPCCGGGAGRRRNVFGCVGRWVPRELLGSCPLLLYTVYIILANRP